MESNETLDPLFFFHWIKTTHTHDEHAWNSFRGSQVQFLHQLQVAVSNGRVRLGCQNAGIGSQDRDTTDSK
jgi:hypothetical protein